MKTKKNTVLFLFLLIQLSLVQPVFVAASAVAIPSGIHVTAFDTVAGYGTALKAENVSPAQTIVFTVQQPSGQQLFFSAVANASGVATHEMGDYYTRQAGIYYLSAELKGSRKPGMPSSFTVYPDNVSASRSLFESDSPLVHLNSSTQLSVQLMDAYGNPISGHQIRILSHRNSDIVDSVGDSFTDSDGSIFFSVSSEKSGIATFTAYDATSEIVLEKRVQIFFTDSEKNDLFFDSSDIFSGSESDSLQNVGGDNVGGDFGKNFAFASVVSAQNNISGIHTFEFEDIPEKIHKGEPFSLTIAAYDNEKNVVIDYEGKIHFSISGSNAPFSTLPEDYIFEPEDLGKHTFSLGFAFQEKGNYVLKVSDFSNNEIYGEKELPVLESKDAPSLFASSSVSIMSPGSGKSRDSVQIVSGQAVVGKDVKIFDNSILLGTATADTTGNFTFTTPPLSDGDHLFSAAAVQENGTILGTSNTVSLTTDSTPPEIFSFSLKPASVSPGDPVEVTLTSEKDLTKVSLNVADTLYDLESDLENPDTYKGSFPAPTIPGQYSVTVFLADELGNEISYQNQGSFTVSGSQKPSAVPSIHATSSDSRVNLVWASASDDFGVRNYRIYYGVSPDSLTQKVETSDASTTWYLSNLQNGVEYFFLVLAVDHEGQEGALSPLIRATPNLVTDVLFPSASSVMGETGPAFLWLLFPSYFLARKLRKK